MKEIRCTILLFFIANLIYAQGPWVKQWDYRFGGYNEETLTSLQQTSDGGYILAGTSGSGIGGDKTEAGQGGADFWIVKTDSLGIKLWDKRFGGTSNDALYSIQQTSDGGYILGGYSDSGIGGDKTQSVWGYMDYWIVKVDSLGNKEWDKDFGGTDTDWLEIVRQTPDGGYIVGGWSASGISGDKTQGTVGGTDYWIVKTDPLGAKQWDKDFGGTAGDELLNLDISNDGGYILGGRSSSGIGGDKTQANFGNSTTKDYWIVKIDSTGTKQWDKDFGGTESDELWSLQQTSDNGFILGGYSYSGISGNKTQTSRGISDYWMVKTDSAGIKQWDKRFGGTNEDALFVNVFQTPDGGYLIDGTSSSPGNGDKTENNLGQSQTWIVKTNSSGIKQWDKTIFTTGDDVNSDFTQTADGCYAIGVRTRAGIGGYKTQVNWGTNSTDYWIVKFCDSTSTTSLSQLSNDPDSFSVYPNPAENKLTIVSNNSQQLTIINLLGKVMLEKNISSDEVEIVELDISFLSPGIYFIRSENVSDSYRIRKFVKE